MRREWLACLHQVSAARVRLRRQPGQFLFTYLIRTCCTSSSCAATPLRLISGIIMHEYRRKQSRGGMSEIFTSRRLIVIGVTWFTLSCRDVSNRILRYVTLHKVLSAVKKISALFPFMMQITSACSLLALCSLHLPKIPYPQQTGITIRTVGYLAIRTSASRQRLRYDSVRYFWFVVLALSRRLCGWWFLI